MSPATAAATWADQGRRGAGGGWSRWGAGRPTCVHADDAVLERLAARGQ
jgi:hypothetical protein